MQDVDIVPGVNEDLGCSAIPDVYGDDQSIIMREEDGVGVCIREGEISLLGVEGGPVKTI